MTILHFPPLHKHQQEHQQDIISNVAQLQAVFGTKMTSSLLTAEPGLVARSPATVADNYHSMIAALPLGPADIDKMLLKSPNLLSCKGPSVAAKLEQFKDVFKVLPCIIDAGCPWPTTCWQHRTCWLHALSIILTKSYVFM